jgi:hypothetical protein
VCARILAAAEPRNESRAVANALDSDRTADRLGATLPILDEDQVIAAIGWPEIIDEAFLERFDLLAVSVRVEGADPARSLRARHSDINVRLVDMWDPVLEHTARLLVPANAIGPSRALVPQGTADAIATIKAAEVWLVGGVGRVLPARLYDMVLASLGEIADEYEECSLERFDRLAGPRGVERTAEAAARVDCPVPPELLRPLAL